MTSPRILTVDDSLRAKHALRLIDHGQALLWQGDFHNARQLLTALGRRLPVSGATFTEYRAAQARRTAVLNALYVPLLDLTVPLRRAPDVRTACLHAYGETPPSAMVPLRELLGVIGAHQLYLRGIDVPAAGGRIHPWYGVFAPTRPEYLELVARCPLPSATTVVDLGTGSGVLAAILARRTTARIVATDLNPRAVGCARENAERLGFADRIDGRRVDLYPAGRAGLIVCNPPWLPAQPQSPLDQAVYDEDGRMLRGFLDGLTAHLEPGGEGWLILSDLAEHLGLRTRSELLRAFDRAGLKVAGRLDAAPTPRRRDSDPLSAARAREVISLWRLCP
ncbi:methyltransferase family protein [Kribbella amoyensis]|uniref:Methyltransferase family protein n=1 Tax=Kribbella amoyensis TaxID=996641 RepID=A0A561BJX8_9ACTN|nr:class I SAM-dependent methyltransferase [Kribbella amoyensis]TWD79150.1 methyltransferase family protein [Kribbella amoyensis]